MKNNTNPIVSVIGLGYVGIHVAVAFAKAYEVIGYDINSEHINFLKKGQDNNNEIDKNILESVQIHYTNNINDLKKSNFFIVAVPTPIEGHKIPNLSFLLEATSLLGKTIKKNDTIVYESTVYPGVTEDLCIPLLERVSNLKCGKDFFVGYSPERVNPGDKVHLFANTNKIVSGTNSKTIQKIIGVYSKVITGQLYIAPSIRVAESAKIVENTQRDINIAFMNEMAIILNNLGINSKEVFEATKTKWNFLPFSPGFVGGHCISFNSHLLTYKSEEAGYISQLIYSARHVNTLMPKYIARETIKRLIKSNVKVKNCKIGIFGITYKEDWPDCKQSEVVSMIDELKKFDVEIFVHDPIADKKQIKKLYGLDLIQWHDLPRLDAIIISVAHTYYRNLKSAEISTKLKGPKYIIDVKSILNPEECKNKNINLWQI